MLPSLQKFMVDCVRSFVSRDSVGCMSNSDEFSSARMGREQIVIDVYH